MLTPLSLPSSSVSLSYFILSVPTRKCLGKHLCTSSPFLIAILNGTFFARLYSPSFGRSFAYQNRIILLWPGASQWRICYHRMWGQLSTTCSNLLKQPNGELLVSVDRRSAKDYGVRDGRSNWLVAPPPLWVVLPAHLVHSINQCSLGRQSTLQRSAWEATTLPLRPLKI